MDHAESDESTANGCAAGAYLHRYCLPVNGWTLVRGRYRSSCSSAMIDLSCPLDENGADPQIFLSAARLPSLTHSTVALSMSSAGPTGISCSRGLSLPPTTGDIPACPMLLRIAMAVWAAASRATEMQEKEQATRMAAAFSATLHRTGIDALVGRRPFVYSLTDSPGTMTTHFDTKAWVRLTTSNSCHWRKRSQEAMPEQRSSRWHIKSLLKWKGRAARGELQVPPTMTLG